MQKASDKASLLNNIGHGALVLIGGFGHIVSLILIIIEHSREEKKLPTIFWGVVAILILTLIASLILFFGQRSKIKSYAERELELLSQIQELSSELVQTKKYKNAFSNLTNAFRDIHMAVWSKSPSCSLALTNFCSNLSQTFTNIKGVDCHVAIKMLNLNNSKKLEVITVARDAYSGADRAKKRRTVQHLVSENTDFRHIINAIKKGTPLFHFSNNDLCKKKYYSNSSWKSFGYPPNRFNPEDSITVKETNWTLEYRSTIVVPIYPGNGMSSGTQYLLGFICIHSKAIDVFEEIDLDIINGCADSLINVLPKCLGIMKPIP